MAAPKSIAAWRLGEWKSLAIWPVSPSISPTPGEFKAFTAFHKSYVDHRNSQQHHCPKRLEN